jgi:small subunit ribosomal protein S6
MPLYNITAIARASLPQQEVHNLLSKVSKIVLERGGVMAGIRNWGVQDLAYRMKARQDFHTRGRFMQLKLVASPDALKELERNMKIDERLLRWMIIKEKNTSIASLGSLEQGKLAESANLLFSSLNEDPPGSHQQ